jgi:hypothetical protein
MQAEGADERAGEALDEIAAELGGLIALAENARPEVIGLRKQVEKAKRVAASRDGFKVGADGEKRVLQGGTA